MKTFLISMTGFLLAISAANAQPACPTGESLRQQAYEANEAFLQISFEAQSGKISSAASKRARALAFLSYANAVSDSDYEALDVFLAPTRDCHPDDCGGGIVLSKEEREAFMDVASSISRAYTDGTPELPWAPALKNIPTKERLEWAEDVLNCYGASNKKRGVDLEDQPYYSPPSTTASTLQPQRRVERVFGDWARGSGHYCRNNERQTDLYAMANARKVCRDRGGSDGGTYISNSGYDWYRSNSEQCYQAKAYTNCVFE